MLPQTYIFIGRSGSGKGTQASLLIEYLKKQTPEQEVFHIETGKEFKTLREGKTYTHSLINEKYNSGGLMPEFLAIWIWSNFFVQNLKGNEHVIMDGVARRFREAEILDSAFKFYKRPKPTIVYINVSVEWAFERLMARKRVDDKTEEIKNRLSWFDSEVSKSIDFYKNNLDYYFLDINGEQTIEKVQEEIISKMKASI